MNGRVRVRVRVDICSKLKMVPKPSQSFSFTLVRLVLDTLTLTPAPVPPWHPFLGQRILKSCQVPLDLEKMQKVSFNVCMRRTGIETTAIGDKVVLSLT